MCAALLPPGVNQTAVTYVIIIRSLINWTLTAIRKHQTISERSINLPQLTLTLLHPTQCNHWLWQHQYDAVDELRSLNRLFQIIFRFLDHKQFQHCLLPTQFRIILPAIVYGSAIWPFTPKELRWAESIRAAIPNRGSAGVPREIPSGQERILLFERGSSRSHCVEEPFWKRPWTCRESDRILNEWIILKSFKVFNFQYMYLLNAYCITDTSDRQREIASGSGLSSLHVWCTDCLNV
jgi:hypothetical protein